MDPRHVYMEMVGLEKQLREVLRASPLNARDANALRSRLMDKAKRIADASAPFAASKEVEQVLWKPCFYKRIEDFRRRIRKYASAAAADRNIREHFARVSAEFQQFLTEAAGFYAHLRDAFAKWLQQQTAHGSGDNSVDANVVRCRQSLHRCYVFLGDLARYRELHSQKSKKNFAAAESFYHRALAVLPENGNPHNQLAVLATYVEAETVAVYRYCRSLLTAQPFATAEENLALLFERSRQRPLASPVTLATSASSKDKSAFLKSYLHRLTRMHGILFALATPRRSSPASTARNATGGLDKTPAYSRDMEVVLTKDLRALLRVGVMGDALLLKVVVINIFCVERACSSSASVSAPLEDALRLATLTVTSVLTHLAETLDAKSSAVSNGNATSNGRTVKDPLVLALRLLGPVTVFCDYLRVHQDVLEQLEERSTGRQQTSGADDYASVFVEALATLVNHVKLRELYAPLLAAETQAYGSEPPQVREHQHLLKESLELRGFAPLKQDAPTNWPDDWALQTPATGAGGGASALTPLADPEAGKLRAWKLYRFARFLCDGYEGDPLLFQGVDGQFATTPVVDAGSKQTNTKSQNFSSFPLGLMPNGFNHKQQPQAQPQHDVFSNGVRTGLAVGEDEDDNFDDEVIVFQPSPALRGLSGGQQSTMNGEKQHNGLLDSAAPSPLDALSNGGAFSLRAPSPISSSDEQRRLSIESQSSTYGGVTNGSTNGNGAIGSSLGYPNFHTFSGLGSFSGQGMLAGWGSVNDDRGSSNNLASNGLGLGLGMGFISNAGDLTSSKNPPGFPTRSSSANSSQSFGATSNNAGDSGFSPMADLAAVERESALYQRGGSSLSAFLGASSTATQSQKALAPAPAPRPPPGFAGASTGNSTENQWLQPQHQQQQKFYAHNPFINS